MKKINRITFFGVRRKLLLGFGLLAALVIALGSIVWGYSELDRRVVPSKDRPASKGVDGSQTYVTIKYPDLPDWQAVDPKRPIHTFYVPMAYVYLGGIVKSKTGLSKIPVEYELPSKLPYQDRSWMKEGTPEHVELMTTWIGRFSAELPGGGADYEITKLLQRVNGYQGAQRWVDPSSKFIHDGSENGLTRYSDVNCFDEKVVTTTDPKAIEAKPNIAYEQEQYRNAVASRPQDDPITKPYCFIWRAYSELFTPPESTPVAEQVYVTCRSHDCDAFINVAKDWGVTVRMSRKNLPRWREIVQGTRELFLSFLEKPGIAGASSPAPVKTSGISK